MSVPWLRHCEIIKMTSRLRAVMSNLSNQDLLVSSTNETVISYVYVIMGGGGLCSVSRRLSLKLTSYMPTCDEF